VQHGETADSGVEDGDRQRSIVRRHDRQWWHGERRGHGAGALAVVARSPWPLPRVRSSAGLSSEVRIGLTQVRAPGRRSGGPGRLLTGRSGLGRRARLRWGAGPGGRRGARPGRGARIRRGRPRVGGRARLRSGAPPPPRPGRGGSSRVRPFVAYGKRGSNARLRRGRSLHPFDPSLPMAREGRTRRLGRRPDRPGRRRKPPSSPAPRPRPRNRKPAERVELWCPRAAGSPCGPARRTAPPVRTAPSSPPP
jgi:hypothetical protein